jgi:Restriction endonuclease AspBHI N-terminal/Restriction endonuclease
VSAPVVDGLPNFFFETRRDGSPLVILERGINPIRATPTSAGPVRPAVLIRSSPHRAGSTSTPWQDFFDPDNGHVRYFGDQKMEKTAPPEQAPGNKILLEERALHTAHDEASRMHAAPLLFFLAVPHGGRIKGNVKFQGVGVIDKVELVSQWDRHAAGTFANYRFDVVILSLAREAEDLDWSWISARRDPTVSLEDSLKLAPSAWRQWVKEGAVALPRLRRSVAYQSTTDPLEQRPAPGSREAQVLADVYAFYAKKKSAFEGLAEVVAEHLFRSAGNDYARGWITPRSGDHGADFVGRLDIGLGFAKTRLVVLGQAKCEKPSLPTGGRHIARTAARLRRGWIGVYVTTSFFSRPVQAEVIEDEYPLVLINGLQLAEILREMMFERGLKSVQPILEELEASYESRISFRRPSEILLD